MEITIPITKKHEKIIDLHEQVIKNFHKARIRKIGHFEGQFQCAAMMLLIILDIDAICDLAKKNLIYLPTANLISRRIFDVSMQIAWILKPDDPFEQEARWLRYAFHSKNSELHFFQACLKTAKRKKLDDSALLKTCQGISEFYSSVEEALDKKTAPKKYEHTHRPPNMSDILKEIGGEDDYLIFNLTSQFAHGGNLATQCFTRGYGSSKEIGVFISPDNWDTCFKTTMMSFLRAGIIFLEKTGGDVHKFIPPVLKIEIQETIGVKFHIIK
jgi:hypothetical protein